MVSLIFGVKIGVELPMTIEIRQMTVKDFVHLMQLNAGVYPEFDVLSDEQKSHIANLNIVTGCAESFFEDGKLVAVGGIRYVGVGEAWLITPPKIRDRSLSLLKETRKIFVKRRDEHNLWRIFATSKISKTFLGHLGFKELPEAFCWMRMR